MRGGTIGGSIVFARHFVLREQNLKIDSIHQYNPPSAAISLCFMWAPRHLMQASFAIILLQE